MGAELRWEEPHSRRRRALQDGGADEHPEDLPGAAGSFCAEQRGIRDTERKLAGSQGPQTPTRRYDAEQPSVARWF